MKDVKVILLDLNPGSSLSEDLERILRSSEDDIQTLKESLGPSESSLRGSEIPNRLCRHHPDLIFLVASPLEPNRLDGLVQLMRNGGSEVPIILVAEGETDGMIELLRLGIDDFITPPLKPVEILPRIWRLVEHRRHTEPLIHKLKEKLGLRQLIGQSAPFLAELEKIPYVAKSNATVLITGETGTGKELFARAIHYLGFRSGHPFVPVNCGSIPVELVENELFGHARGAFTGAHAEHAGLIQDAHGGTVFLDEIDCLPLGAQVKLLRFLQDKEYRQLGSARVIRADVRVIAATNIDLEKAVKEGRFRQDLYYRLNIVPVSLPTLRDRREDIPLLARHFLHKHSSELERDAVDFTSEALRKLTLYDWPGNVRELENVIERAVVFTVATVIQASDITITEIPDEIEEESFQGAKARAVEKFEKDYLRSLLVTHGGNISRAARAAQKNRRAFWELIRKHNIDVLPFKSSHP